MLNMGEWNRSVNAEREITVDQRFFNILAVPQKKKKEN